MLTAVVAVMLYAAGLVMMAGLGYRVWLYARTPAPLKIPTMPAPMTQRGVVMRMFSEVVFFRSLFKGNKWIWLFGWVFHLALALVLMRHLRYFLQPVPEIVVLIQPLGVLAGLAMVAALAALWARRFLVARIRYISGPSDHLMLALLLAIGASGFGMKFIAPTDIVAVKAFFLGLIYFDWQPLPADPALLIHLALVALLMFVFPFSKLLHAPGVFFSPTRNQVDDSRERRHVPPVRLETVPR
ncbi:MAG: respiratory nitrate reductase subunit gamma [Bradyrhizobium sp.]|uniref:respiratory nitrate reductase subunit gamma n=1 Tax=Bradyrhizobium sp. TaxID=376 RepID=UPI0025BEA437|nr:respiratory nitrate reductase subunit gamma [Bradyrhizobium sp.]MBI5263325.1 respiratory nitrate reductase subunit gamma [Bradyrhizobium sp.]